MKKLITSALFALVLSINIYAQEKTYFDENWQKTTQDKMEYYRETESKGKLTLIKDFYKDGILQMEGLATDTTPGSEVFDGKVTWYTPEGKVISTVTYSNGKQLGPSQSYDAGGRLMQDMVYHADGTFSGKMLSYKDPEGEEYNYNTITIYENSQPSKTVVYDEDIKGIRYEMIMTKDNNYETKYYGEKGKYLGSGVSSSGETMMVDYYSNPMRIAKIEKYKSDGSVKESLIYSKNGQIRQEQKMNKKDGYKTTYDESGKRIGHLVYQYEKDNETYTPLDGEDYQLNYDYTQTSAIDVYKNGSIVLNKYFDENGKLVSEKSLKDDITQEIKYYSPDGKLKSTLTYQDNMPYNGTLYEGYIEMQYKNGTLVNMKTFTEGQKLKSEKRLNTAQNLYEATIYDNKGTILYTFTQPSKENQDYYSFTGQIVQYVKGKPASKAAVKDGILQSGKVKLRVPNGIKELEHSGKWILLKAYNTEGKLVQDSKILADAEDYFYGENPANIQEEYLYNDFE